MTSDIAHYFIGKSIFITGVSGFLGKVLLEKLARTCPGFNQKIALYFLDIQCFYLLIRQKKGISSIDRLKTLLDSPLFGNLPNKIELEKKIRLIDGDISAPFLGISEDDREILFNNVHVVFHLAATVRFDECLRDAINFNITAVKKLVQLCLQMKKLEALVHTSTAYVNCCRRHDITEAVYTSNIDPEWLIEAAEWMSSETLDSITPLLLNKHPNTYTFTKSMAEIIIERAVNCENLRAVIFRPSIIGCTRDEPFEGWLENFNGPPGIYTYLGKGVLRTIMGNTDAVADIIPVDVCASMLIAIAWHTANLKRSFRESFLKVFHCTSGHIDKPCTWGTLEKISVRTLSQKTPLENPILIPREVFTTNRFLLIIRRYFEQTIPAYFMDGWLRCRGQKPTLVSVMYRKPIMT